jgi:hypothetical protein
MGHHRKRQRAERMPNLCQAWALRVQAGGISQSRARPSFALFVPFLDIRRAVWLAKLDIHSLFTQATLKPP